MQRWNYDVRIPSCLTDSVSPPILDVDDSVSCLSSLLHTVFSNVKECIRTFVWHSHLYTYKKLNELIW